MDLNELSLQLQAGQTKKVVALVQQAIDEGFPAKDILQTLLDGMSVVGERFKNEEIYVPEVLVVARAMNKGTNLLKPILSEEGVSSVGKVILGTVEGDMHDIGKNLVRLMLEAKGFEVVDLGTNVPAKNFIQSAVEHQASIICCSALLTTTMDVLGDVVNAAKEAGIRDNVKIMIGGAPVTEEFCRKIGADAYTDDAASAAEVALSFVK